MPCNLMHVCDALQLDTTTSLLLLGLLLIHLQIIFEYQGHGFKVKVAAAINLKGRYIASQAQRSISVESQLSAKSETKPIDDFSERQASSQPL